MKKDIKNLVSKKIFARWQAKLSFFDFEIDYIKGGRVIPLYFTDGRDRGRIFSPQISVDNEGFTIVTKSYYQRGGYLSSQKKS